MLYLGENILRLSDIELKEFCGPQIGISMFVNGSYYLTYTSLNDCITDLVYHFAVTDIENICKGFYARGKAVAPYKYRAVCSELYEPTDHISRYVIFANTLSEIIREFDKHESRAISIPDKFTFGIQGIGIYLFNPETNKYEYWLGGGKPNSVSDILMQAKEEKKFVPDDFIKELQENRCYDIFISHKSSDYKIAKTVYDKLIKENHSVFLSEISLPAVSNADYSYEIDAALSVAEQLLVIATSIESINSGWIKYEWTSFANELRSGRKNGNIITINYGINIANLPYLLRQYEVIDFHDDETLFRFLSKK